MVNGAFVSIIEDWTNSLKKDVYPLPPINYVLGMSHIVQTRQQKCKMGDKF